MPQSVGLYYNLLSRPDRPTIIFLHGFLGGSDDWEMITNDLSNQFGILMIDLPGHGQNSSTNENDFLIENCAKNIISLSDQLRLTDLILVGYSMGGRLAFYLLTHYPGRFKRAVIESANPGLKRETERQQRIINDTALAEQLERTDLKDWLGRWYTQPLFASLRDNPARLEKVVKTRINNDKAGLAMSLKMMTSGRQPDLWPKLGKIDIPLLLIAGELDSKYSELAKQTADLCPNAQAVIIKQAGHNVHLEQPELYLTELKRFLTRDKKVKQQND